MCSPLLRSALAVLLAVLIVPSAYAFAPTPDGRREAEVAGETGGTSEAEEHLEAAAVAFDAGDYDTAVAQFEEAYSRSGDPACLFNIGRVHEEAGELEAALARYEEFVVEPGVELGNRAMANERIGVLREILATRREPEASVPPPTVVQPADRQPASAVTPSGRGLIIAGSVTAGVGAVAVIVGGVFQSLSARSASGVNSAPSRERRDELVADAVRQATVGDATLISGAVLVAAGVPMLVVGLLRRKKSAASDVAIRPGGFTLRF